MGSCRTNLVALIAALGIASCGTSTSSPTGDVQSAPVMVPAAATPTATRTPRVEEPAPPDPRAEARAKAEAEEAAFNAAYPLHGVVYHYLAQVFAQPNNTSRVVGYVRRGAQFRAKARVTGPGCPGGWHEVPGRGFVCAGNGYQIGETPQTFDPSPVAPDLNSALPYAYARTVRDDVPQYWSVPTAEEVRVAEALVERMAADAARREAAATAAATVATPTPSNENADAVPSTNADDVVAPPPPGQTAEVGSTANGALPDFFRMRMLRGFYVSLDRADEDERGHDYYRTVRGGYVEAEELTEATPPSMRGVVLGGGWHLPVAFVFRGGAHRFHLNHTTDTVVDDGVIERQTPLVVVDDNVVRRNRQYVMSDDGVLVREPAIRMIRAVSRPPGVPQHAKWIHVSLAQQSLVAYDGDNPVFATLVSTGKEGHETPTGLFQIQSKHISTTMDDEMSPDGAYSIEDVPWTMYFQGNFALHGAFWHGAFGTVHSHGCVNIAPADARWLFQWSTPTLPAPWHGVFADRRNQGTWVFITE